MGYSLKGSNESQGGAVSVGGNSGGNLNFGTQLPPAAAVAATASSTMWVVIGLVVCFLGVVFFVMKKKG